MRGRENKVQTSFTDIVFKVHYPDKNPKEAIQDITLALEYLGAFDGLNK